MYISDIITQKEMNSWNKGDVITIKAGTGKGKSHFIKYELYEKAKREDKRILMLIHRRNCVDQFHMEIEREGKHDTGVIDIRTYQSIEAVEKAGLRFNLDSYDYIVCDEFHYFMSDASFNFYTDMSLKRVIKSHTVKILMSATGDHVNNFLKEYLYIEPKSYQADIDYRFINEVNVFYDNETIDDIAKDAIKDNRKVVFFIQSATKAYEYYEKYRDVSIFNCGKSHKLYENVNPQQINDLLMNEGYDKTDDTTAGKLLLFTTTVMDAGVNLIMDNLNDIVVDVEDTGTLIQCIGRKRLTNKDDYINLYIRAINNQRLGGLETQAKKRLELADYFIKHGERALVQDNYRRLNDAMIYDEPSHLTEYAESTKKLNLLMYFKVKFDLQEINKIKKKGAKHAHARYLVEDVLKIGSFTVIDEQKKNNELEEYLDSIVGEVMLRAGDRKELIEKLNVRRDGKLLKSLDSLNAAMEEMNINYYIHQFETTRRVNGNKKKYKSAWKVMKKE